MRTTLILGCVIVAACLWIVFTTLGAVVGQHHALPYLDDWVSAGEASAVEEGLLSWDLLTTPHAEHRIAFPRLFFYADYRWFSGAGTLVQFVNCALQLLSGISLCVLMVRPGSKPGAAPWIGGSLILACMLWGPQVLNLGWNIQLSVFLVLCSTTCALAALSRARKLTEGDLAVPMLVLVAAIAAATVATFSRANGVLCWPLLILAAWRLQLGRAALGALLGAAAFVAWLHFTHYSKTDNPAMVDPVQSLGEIYQVTRFVVCYLGMPVRSFGVEPAVALGALGLLSAAAALSQLIADRSLSGRAIVLRTMLLFPLGTAFVTALGRIPNAPDWPHRYVSASMYFWSILIAVTAQTFTSRTPWTRRPAVRVTAAVAALAITALLLIQQREGLSEQRGRLDAKRRATLSLWTDVHDEPALAAVLPADAHFQFHVFADLRRTRRSVFAAPQPFWIGTEFSDRFEVLPGASAGSFDSCRPLAATSPTGFYVSGRITSNSGAAPAAIVVVDPEGRIVGLGEAGLTEPEQPGSEQAKDPDGSWSGYARMPEQPAAVLTAYSVAADGTARRMEGAQVAKAAPTLRRDSIRGQFIRLRERGPLDLHSEAVALAGALHGYLNASLPEDLELVPATAGSGAVLRVEHLIDKVAALRVTGWAWNTAVDEAPRAVLLLDETRRVIGVTSIASNTVDPAQRRAPFEIIALTPKSDDFDLTVAAVGGDPTKLFAVPRPGSDASTVRTDQLGPPIRFGSAEASDGWTDDSTIGRYIPLPRDLVSDHGKVFDSWAGSDGNTGALRLGPFVPGTRRTLGIPIFAGPVATNLSVRVLDLDRGTTLAQLVAPAGFRGRWRAWRCSLPADVAEHRLSIVFEDRGGGWGEWFAVVRPRWIE